MANEGGLSALGQQLVKWRRNFHQFPEVSRKEMQTALMIVEALREMEIKAETFSGHYGVCAVIRGSKPGPVVAFRADMDALAVAETNQVPYKSVNDGVMHACGHDGHMSIILGVAKMFFDVKETLAGTVKVIFQPAEEDAPRGGADLMLNEGILDDADVIFGMHLWPDLPCGQIGIRKGPQMAASDRLTIKIFGHGAHAGQPQHGVDAITIAADVIQGMGHILTRQLDPLETATVSIGSIQGGERYNVIAREVVLYGTARTLGEEVRKELPVKIERMLKGISSSQGGDYDLSYQFGYPVLKNWEEPTNLVVAAARTVVGNTGVDTQIKPVLASEDFAKYLIRTPGAFFWLGCGRANQEACVLHSSDFDIDEDSLLIGVRIMYQTGLAALEHYRRSSN
jgi:amidohydrolase